MISTMVAPIEQLSVRASRLEKATRWMEGAQGVPDSVKVAVDASLWFAQIESLRDVENEALARGEYESILEEHRMLVSQLIASGEMILFAAKKRGLPPGFDEFSIEDLQAEINSLSTTLRCQHGPHNHPAVNSQIATLLNGAK